ncbi:queuosine precursor transporter [Daejeonella sp.]|uniref:queuosine precursor transporter n=1 Tax=Daejeonella sp. TaxID=2805397 RepID=UPI00271F1D9F|nr:queuosine precursor transporter [Daejeonella sp.]MDO8992120.1 queuosine precursor transporter [Daejeonella sp.]MDP2414494.1 queuosine precursor transporter [Daejeonella sp.]
MTYKSKESRLLLILGTFLVANAILAEFIGVKIFTVEGSLGMEKFNIDMFGVPDLSFNMSAGVVTWPLIFIMTDIINEYFGVRQVRFLSILAAILISYAFLVVGFAMNLVPSDFWVNQKVDGVDVNMNAAFNGIFGQGMWIIAGSIIAFLIGQMADVILFHRIKKLTGERLLWLRATGSTLVSQMIDSFVVIFIAFYLNPQYNWSWQMVAAIGLVNYTYKFIVAILMTPLLYGVHKLIDKFLGKDLSAKLIAEAAKA